MRRWRACGTTVLALCLFGGLAGCSSFERPPARKTFMLELDGGGTDVSARTVPRAVYVAPVSVAEPFSGRNLVLRQSEAGFRVDPYNEFAANPSALWTEAVRLWLDAHRCFERVLPYGSSAEAPLTLETSLLQAVIDLRSGRTPSAVVAMRFLLIENAAPDHVLLDRTVHHAETLNGEGPEAEVAALAAATRAGLQELAAALAQLPQ